MFCTGGAGGTITGACVVEPTNSVAMSPKALISMNTSNAVIPLLPGGLGWRVTFCRGAAGPGPKTGHNASEVPHRGQNRAPAGVCFQHRGHRTKPSIRHLGRDLPDSSPPPAGLQCKTWARLIAGWNFPGGQKFARMWDMEEIGDKSARSSPLESIEPLRWIGAYKLLKAALSLLGGLMILRLMHRNLPEVAEHWMGRLHIRPHSLLGGLILHRILLIKRGSLGLAAGLLFAYVPLAVAEGVGLMLRKVWAEWLAVITTAALIPLEMYENIQRFTWVRLAILLANVAVLLYLIVRIWRDRGKHATSGGFPLTSPAPAEGHFSQSTIPQPPVRRSDVPE